MSRRTKRKLNRAYSVLTSPAGTTMYVPPGQLQGVLGQVFYGSKASIPTSSTTMFSPGQPLAPQPGVNPGGQPVQFRFPIAYNTFPVDRTLGKPDIPSFQQLRHLAKLDWGIGLCERKLLRMILALKLTVKLTKRAVAGGAEEKQYQDEINYFTDWFSKPDPYHNVTIHEWIQQAVIEQTQIDELYIYKNRTRGGKLLSLPIIDGSEMKPLLDDWGHLAQDYAYQQYPWGLPGMKYPMKLMIHRRETPATDTPYGRSCVERVIGPTNLALRKFKQDLAHFTEGNVPAGMLSPPEGSNWTPDLIDAYEQSWNSLIAGSPQQQMRIRVTQPGFTYTPFEQQSLDAVIDRFWLNIRASAYNIPMDALGFTETSNRSTGEVQKDVLYEQALYPYVAIYEAILTDILQHDFEPSLHGDLFEVSFGGYEPPEDEQAKAATLSTYTGAGILGLTNAAKLAGLPEDPDAPHIGRMLPTATGPIFLDDYAAPDMRKAASEAQKAGYEMATHPPDPTEQQNSNNKGENDNAASKHSAGNSTSSSAGSAPRGTGTSHTTGPSRGEERAVYAIGTGDGRNAYSLPDHEGQQGIHSLQLAYADAGAEAREESEDEDGALERHLPGKHDQKEHGVWASHKHGSRLQKFADGLQKKAASYSAMADRKLSAHWTAQDARIASNIAHDLRHIASVLNADPHATVATMLKQMLAEAQKLHEMAPHAMSEHRLQVLEHTLEQYQHASAGGSHAAHSSHAGNTHHAHRAIMEDDFEQGPPENAEAQERADRDAGRAVRPDASERTQQNVTSYATDGLYSGTGQSDVRAGAGLHQSTRSDAEYGDSGAKSDYKRWRQRAIDDVKSGRVQRGFTSTLIPGAMHGYISQLLHACTTVDEVRAVFARAQQQESEIAGSDQRLVYNASLDIWEPEDTEQQLERMKAQGVKYLRWQIHASHSGVCPLCDQNVGQVVELGQPFKNGCRLPQCHVHCQCSVEGLVEMPK